MDEFVSWVKQKPESWVFENVQLQNAELYLLLDCKFEMFQYAAYSE